MGRREEVEAWLTDMDGVLVHENHALPGAAELLQQWEDAGTPYLVLTNNSIFTARDLSARLRASGLNVPEDRIWTSALATADFLKQQLPGGTAFVIGEGGLLTALHQHGYAIVDHDPDYVVVGEGRTFNLELVEAAVRMILGGAKLVATNLDPNCPTKDGLRPGCGAMVAMLETATGVKAFSVGKPGAFMMRAARKELGLTTDQTTMIGDTMSTDILGGVQLGFHTVLVLSGGTSRESLRGYAYQPELVVSSVAELHRILDAGDWEPWWLTKPQGARAVAPTKNAAAPAREKSVA